MEDRVVSLCKYYFVTSNRGHATMWDCFGDTNNKYDAQKLVTRQITRFSNHKPRSACIRHRLSSQRQLENEHQREEVEITSDPSDKTERSDRKSVGWLDAAVCSHVGAPLRVTTFFFLFRCSTVFILFFCNSVVDCFRCCIRIHTFNIHFVAAGPRIAFRILGIWSATGQRRRAQSTWQHNI